MSFSLNAVETSSLSWQMASKQVEITLLENPLPPGTVVANLASIAGPVDIYCWYEGAWGLPKAGAKFMKNKIIKPILDVKPEATLYLYSLKGWNFADKESFLSSSTPIGDAINRINSVAVKCIYSSSFFQYCTQLPKESELYLFINEELPKKDWLFQLSAKHKEMGVKVSALFNQQASLFDCVKERDAAAAYSLIQYIEGYYLIQESVRRALSKKESKITIAFVLPNDEGKYYRDLPEEVEKMLQLDFGYALTGIEIAITFQLFEYTKSLRARPYIGQGDRVDPQEIPSYFDFMPTLIKGED